MSDKKQSKWTEPQPIDLEIGLVCPHGVLPMVRTKHIDKKNVSLATTDKLAEMEQHNEALGIKPSELYDCLEKNIRRIADGMAIIANQYRKDGR
ncbi:hypothetical protein OZX67_03940 [Bifidobacterium sp. ESL0728]|uniref:hypothetical protein n=1 Tax=Bifidobacterium sp. ESL0728 TaxID=2983220 RepID=UPI0023F9AFCD|nr:hypothetical protein [Bifidobacterium sp. ESL0728]WEV59699.1 hypothetical protein OZX67_03940 [Bifidobacterium sp. ESL0728]